MQVYKCVCARVCVRFEITGCCLTPCWAGWCSGSFSLTGRLLFQKAARQRQGPVGILCSVHVVSPLSYRFPFSFQIVVISSVSC